LAEDEDEEEDIAHSKSRDIEEPINDPISVEKNDDCSTNLDNQQILVPEKFTEKFE